MKNNKKKYIFIGIVLVLVVAIIGVIFFEKQEKPVVVVPEVGNIDTLAAAEKLFNFLDSEGFYFAASYEKKTYLSDNSYDLEEKVLSIYENKIKNNLYLSKTKEGTIFIFDKNLEKEAKIVPSLSIAKNGVFFNFNINYSSNKALEVFGVNVVNGTKNGFYPLSTTFKQNFYMEGNKIDMTLISYAKRDLVIFDNTFLKTLLVLEQPTANLKVELLSDNKNYTFTIEKNINKIIQEMAWLVKNYDILKASLAKLLIK